METHNDVDTASETVEAPAKHRRPATKQVWGAAGAVVAIALIVILIITMLPSKSGTTPAPVTVSPTTAALVAPGLLDLGGTTEVSLPGGSVVSITTGTAAWFAEGDPAPNDGEQYLVFDLAVKYISGPPVDIAPSQLTVRWLTSATPNAAPTAISGGHVATPAQFGPVGPTSEISGQVAYTLPPTGDVVLRLSDAQGAVLARWAVPAPQ